MKSKRFRVNLEVRCNLRWARKLWAGISPIAFVALKQISELYEFSVPLGDVLFLDGRWYVTHVGLVRLAHRKSCTGIRAQIVRELCDVATSRWAFKATVYTHQGCKGFVGYGDADPSNVSPLVHGAEMRVAETRAVNRALRKAYGIGICSVEEIGSFAEPAPVLPGVEEAPAAAGQWKERKLRWPQGPRPPLPADPPASTRCQPASSPTPSISAAPRPSAKPPASRSKLSSLTWPTGPRKTAMPCSASSTAISAARKVRHEALFRVAPSGRCVSHSLGSGRNFPGPGGSGPVSLAQTEALLRDPLRRLEAQASDRVFHDRPPVLHTQGHVEAELVSPRLWL